MLCNFNDHISIHAYFYMKHVLQVTHMTTETAVFPWIQHIVWVPRLREYISDFWHNNSLIITCLLFACSNNLLKFSASDLNAIVLKITISNSSLDKINITYLLPCTINYVCTFLKVLYIFYRHLYNGQHFWDPVHTNEKWQKTTVLPIHILTHSLPAI